MRDPLRVAVVGASGIGQHHAHWYHLSGCEVVAFAGTSNASCLRTAERLRGYFGFDGRAYTDVSRMLAEEQPDILDVSSPFFLHREHAIAGLEAGTHVVCEKPLCWDVNKDLDTIYADGEAVVAAADQANRLLAVSAQYPAVIPVYRGFYERVRGAMGPVETLVMEMESKGRSGSKSREEVWIDLATHPLSLVIGFLPGGKIDYETARCVVGEWETRVTFDYVTAAGRCAVEIMLGEAMDGPSKRRFGVNGFMVDWAGHPDEQGIYRALLKHGSDEVRCNDFMHILIEAFAEKVRGNGGEVIVSGADGLLNLAYQVELLRRAERV